MCPPFASWDHLVICVSPFSSYMSPFSLMRSLSHLCVPPFALCVPLSPHEIILSFVCPPFASWDHLVICVSPLSPYEINLSTVSPPFALWDNLVNSVSPFRLMRSGVQTTHRSTPLSVNVFVTLATMEYHCKYIFETLCITSGRPLKC
jgi:hypothetical protein